MKPAFPPNLGDFERYFIPEPNTRCWLWLLAVNRGGYPQLTRKIGDETYCYRAHRVSWEFYRGPIPKGLTLDHLCRMRCCVNPDHLEPIKQRENVLRGAGIPAQRFQQTHCVNGHELSGQNVYWYRGYRQCKPCSRERDKKRRPRNVLRKTEVTAFQ